MSDMSRHQGCVCIVDDDPDSLEAARSVLALAGFEVEAFSSVSELLARPSPEEIACVVTELLMPGMNGVDLIARLRASGIQAAVVVASAHADVRSAVRLMEEGALTVLLKPVSPPELAAAVSRGLRESASRRRVTCEVRAIRERLARLSEAEQLVMDRMLAQMPNKAIANELDMSPRTVDRRRSSVLQKMGVEGIAELAAILASLRAMELPGLIHPPQKPPPWE